MSGCRIPSGVTLIELIVVLAILGLVASVAAPAFRAGAPTAAHAKDAIRRIRAEARRTGKAASDTATIDGARRLVTAWPTGLVLLDSVTDATSVRERQR